MPEAAADVPQDSIGRAVIECAADAIVAFAPDHTATLWNPAAERLFGWRAAEMVGRVPPIIPAELQAEHHAVLERSRTGGQVTKVTRRFDKAGRVVDVREDTSALHGRDGEPLGWVSVFHPVSREEAAQHHDAERLRLVRRLNDVVGDLNAALDLPAVLDRISAALVELTGADAAAFVRVEDDRLRLVSMRGLPESLRGATAELAPSLVGELMRTGKTVLLAGDDPHEQRALGDLIWARLTGLHTIALGMTYVKGEPYGALYALFSGERKSVGHTELELLELLAGHAGVAVANAVAYTQALRQRAYERAVIDASADGIAVLDRDGVVRRWNPAAHALTGVPSERAVGGRLPFRQPEPGEMLTFAIESGTWLNVLCAEIEGTDELVVDFRDVTRAKELEEAKDLFLATTSHELRTPITVVRGFATTLASRWERLSDAERRSAVTTIAERATALAGLVEQLLIGARAGAGELSVRVEPFDLGGVLAAAVTGFQNLSDRHTVTLEAPADLPPVRGDAMATDILLGQLLENAIKYSPDGGPVTVRAVREGRSAVVTVDDEGVGIAPGDQERIFERFTQGETGDRRRFGGVGLGLYIVKQLVVAQGGEIHAAGRAGGGTRMRLTLPLEP